MTSRTNLKTYFETGDRPTQVQFADLIDSLAHVSEDALATIAYVDAGLEGKSSVGHGHAIADTTGLQAALDAKAATSHTHAIANVTGLQAALDAKAATSHTHAIADTTGLQAALDGRANLSGAIFTGQIVLPNGTLGTLALAIGDTGAGIYRDSAANAWWLVSGGIAALRVRGDGLQIAVNMQPSTDGNRALGAFNLRFSTIFMVASRASLGTASGYKFDDGAGNQVDSGVYAVGTTEVGMRLNGTTRWQITTSWATSESPIRKTIASGTGDPTATEFPSGKGGWWKNTTLNETRFWFNDGGTLRKSAALT